MTRGIFVFASFGQRSQSCEDCGSLPISRLVVLAGSSGCQRDTCGLPKGSPISRRVVVVCPRRIMCGMLPMLQENSLFPFNPSLDDEIKRLFDITLNKRPLPTVEEVMEEFRHNGRDFEYCPDVVDTDSSKQNAPRRKKNKKPLPTECVFCRNNGEEETYYRQHLLKDVDGRILCPVLRAYTCPICGACGDAAHTVKYCPKGPYNPGTISTANAFKFLRNSTGKRRSKKE